MIGWCLTTILILTPEQFKKEYGEQALVTAIEPGKFEILWPCMSRGSFWPRGKFWEFSNDQR